MADSWIPPNPIFTIDDLIRAVEKIDKSWGNSYGKGFYSQW
jgi:hypothetical protein